MDMEPEKQIGADFVHGTDREGAMAKADLYKLANYSLKLFKMMDSNTQLEGWVQAKITKAADYVASVYHYLEYEMKFSEYGQAIEDSDMYTAEQKEVLRAKLQEAKDKIKDLKKVQAERIMEATGFRASDKKKGKVEKSEKKQYFVKLEKEGKTKGVTTVADEGEREGDIRDRMKRDNPGWSVASVRAKDTGSGEEVNETFMPTKPVKPSNPIDSVVSGVKNALNKKKPSDQMAKEATAKKKAKKDYDKDGKIESEKDEVIGSRRKAAGLDEASKPDFLDMDKDGNKKEPMKKAVADKKVKEASAKCNESPKGKSCPVHGMKECGMYEASHQEKTTMKHVKNPTAGEKKAAKDIKPGVKGYKDRADMLKSAEKDGRLKG